MFADTYRCQRDSRFDNRRVSDEQPRDDVGTGCCCGTEAALRWMLPMTTGCEALACLPRASAGSRMVWCQKGGWVHVMGPGLAADWRNRF